MPETERIELLLERGNRLQALQLVRGLPLREQVAILDFAGFEPKEIAAIVQKTRNHVSVILYEIRKKRGKELNDAASPEGTDGGDTPSAADPTQDIVQKTL
jgi:DNA-directed RNA polymerase specialized sigma24 family protein